MPKRRICVVTAARAEYGLLYWLMKKLASDSDIKLQIIVCGMHLSPEYGFTYKNIEQDGFTIDKKVEFLLSSDTPVGVTKSLGLATIGFADAYEDLKPDIVVLLGDRYETLAAAQAALIARIPVAHIAGGDVTEGAFDDAIRHSITKMSHLHFVTNGMAANRIRQLGEDLNRIFNVGSPGVDQIKKQKILSKMDLEKAIEFEFQKKNLLITYHPETLDDQEVSLRFISVLDALDSFCQDVGLIFTMPNADPGGSSIRRMIETYVSRQKNAKAYTSLGQLNYLSVMSHVDAVVGNSSSGIMETPSFKKPTVNIGDRQKGRPQASSVINCPAKIDAIADAIKAAFSMNCTDVVNPYGDGNASERIASILKEIKDTQSLIKKRFFDLPFQS